MLDMEKYLEKEVRVKFVGGREVTGTLKGYDALLNLVLDQTDENMRADDDPYKQTGETRSLGLTVCRGTSIILVAPHRRLRADRKSILATRRRTRGLIVTWCVDESGATPSG